MLCKKYSSMQNLFTLTHINLYCSIFQTCNIIRTIITKKQLQNTYQICGKLGISSAPYSDNSVHNRKLCFRTFSLRRSLSAGKITLWGAKPFRLPRNQCGFGHFNRLILLRASFFLAKRNIVVFQQAILSARKEKINIFDADFISISSKKVMKTDHEAMCILFVSYLIIINQ